MTNWEDIRVELEEQKIHEASKLADDAMRMLYALDKSGKMLALFIKKLCAISKLKSYCIDDENQLYVIKKDEYEKLKGKIMTPDYIKRETAMCNHVCGRYYLIEYKYCDSVLVTKGLLENYYGGNVVLLSEDGVYHIKYKDIVHMRPIKMPSLDKFNGRYQELLKTLQEDDVRY